MSLGERAFTLGYLELELHATVHDIAKTNSSILIGLAGRLDKTAAHSFRMPIKVKYIVFKDGSILILTDTPQWPRGLSA